MSRRPTLTTLRAIAPLAVLPENSLVRLLNCANWTSLDPGYCFIRQNDEANAVSFVLSGYVKMMRGEGVARPCMPQGSNERRQRPRLDAMVALIGPGSMVGEAAALLGGSERSSAITLTTSELIRIPNDEFNTLMQASPAFAFAVAGKMAERQIDVERQVELMRGPLEGRVHALLRHCRSIGLDPVGALTNAEIARMVGATRVAVSPIMSRINGRLGPRSNGLLHALAG